MSPEEKADAKLDLHETERIFKLFKAKLRISKYSDERAFHNYNGPLPLLIDWSRAPAWARYAVFTKGQGWWYSRTEPEIRSGMTGLSVPSFDLSAAYLDPQPPEPILDAPRIYKKPD